MITLAVAQSRSGALTETDNLARIAAAAREASARGADILVTPELAVSGYEPARLAAEWTRERSAVARVTLSQIAREAGIALVVSLPLPTEEGTGWSIAALAFDAEGAEQMSYRKTHLYGPDERAAFTAGPALPTVFTLCGTAVAVAVCYDIEFPELARHLARAGAEILLVPTALATGDEFIPDTLVPTRARENLVTIAYANSTGPAGGVTLCGRSVIAGADGQDLARAGAEETLLLATIDPARADAARANTPYLTDRRTDLYG